MSPVLLSFVRSASSLGILRDTIKTHGSLARGSKHFQTTQAFNDRKDNDDLHQSNKISGHVCFLRRSRGQMQDTKLQQFQTSRLQALELENSENSETETKQLKGSRNGWISSLSSLKQYEYESNFLTPTGGHLLVDDELHSKDWKLWRELLNFRHRHYGTEGVKHIFEHIMQRELEMATEGNVAQGLWYRFLQAGTQDTAFLERVVRYASKLLKETGRSWTRLYVTVMTRMMKYDLPTAMRWHKRLKEDFPPTLEDYQKLFQLSLELGSTSIFAAMYKDYPVRPMYGSVIPRLCTARMHDQAFRWHFTLLRGHDLPLDFTAIEPLLTCYADLKDDRRVETVVTSVLEQSTKMKAPLRKFVSDSKVISREIMYRQLGEIHGIAPKQFSDHFCARLFATKIFSVETIINGLEMMGAQSIGHQSLREIVSRDDCECDAVCRHLDRLREAGITLNRSKYSTIIRQAALGNRRWLLRSIIDCDAHPDTFEDLNLQEKMFTMYLSRGDTIQMERTLSAMTSEVPQGSLEMQRLNFILRGHMRLGNRDKVVSMLEKMKAMGIPLTPKSSRHMRVQWLSKRRAGKTGSPSLTLRNLTLVINVMRQTLEAGAALPPEAWKEILRRLGMSGQLAEFRSLALWLADQYANPPLTPASSSALERSIDRIAEQKKLGPTASQISQGQYPIVPVPSVPQLSRQRDTGLALHCPLPIMAMQAGSYGHRSCLHLLFTKSSQQAMIAWGFQEEAKRPRGHRPDIHGWKRRPSWTWGLLLLRQLRERGVPIEKEMVAKACRQRLAQLFGMTRRSKLSVNRTARRMNDRRRIAGESQAQYGEYVREIESIWGQDLFIRNPKSTRRQDVELHGRDPGRRSNWRIMKTEPKQR
ncbi:MAG: hypothetical protein Q9217_003033 [Psora testacea]